MRVKIVAASTPPTKSNFLSVKVKVTSFVLLTFIYVVTVCISDRSIDLEATTQVRVDVSHCESHIHENIVRIW